MIRTSSQLIRLASVAVAFAGTALGQSGDPRVAAHEGLVVASSEPLAGHTEAGVVRLLSFDVPALGATPVEQARRFLEGYGAIFGITGPEQGLVPRSVSTVGSITSVFFQQTFRGVPIFSGQIRVVLETSPASGLTRVVSAGGSLLPDLARGGTFDATPRISPAECARSAANHLGLHDGQPAADPILMIHDPLAAGRAAAPRLVWAVTLGDDPPTQVLCDAQTGEIAFEHVFAYDALQLQMWRDDPGSSDTFLGNQFGLTAAGMTNADSSYLWPQVHTVYNFFATSFNWRGTASTDNGVKVEVSSEVPKLVKNARFFHNIFGETIQFGDGMASLDVFAHEYTHGIIAHSSGLVYSEVSGALNEGYADAMAMLIDDADWRYGEDKIGFPGEYDRNFENPGDSNLNLRQPDQLSEYVTMLPPTEPNDYGAVHFNSGILNKAHYLLAVGGPFNKRPAFPGIGRARMGALAFFVMRHLPSLATFQDARTESIFWAGLLAQVSAYGFLPGDACAVKNAFASVEIGPGDFDCNGVDDNFEDPDKDFVPNSIDNCPTKYNPSQDDWDKDGVGDHCDLDLDNDGVPDAKDNCLATKNWNQEDRDQDGTGDACDTDADGDGVSDASDNCYLYNPGQDDGDTDGTGDACDPDYDGDNIYDGDNCTFVHNLFQTDSDGDGLGDACDLCPAVSDWMGAYEYRPWESTAPKPLQPDSDGDGTPDACDGVGFRTVALFLNEVPFNPRDMIYPGDPAKFGWIEGPGDQQFRIPAPLCPRSGDPSAAMLPEVVFEGLDPTVDVALVDDRGLVQDRLRPGPAGSGARGMRAAPDCSRRYFYEFRLSSSFGGFASFRMFAQEVPAGSESPWTSGGEPLPPPPPLRDSDGDGLVDGFDTCPFVYSPDGIDADRDGWGDACDNCQMVPNPDQPNLDSDPRGDACDCAPDDPGAFAVPDETGGLSYGADNRTLSWPSSAPLAGAATGYDLLRGNDPRRPIGSPGFETCLGTGLASTAFLDSASPGPGQAFSYLVRGGNVCGRGGWGSASDGAARTPAAACP